MGFLFPLPKAFDLDAVPSLGHLWRKTMKSRTNNGEKGVESGTPSVKGHAGARRKGHPEED